MNHSGDAAEQIVRMTLEGAEVALKITGTAAKEIALLLIAALKSPDKGAGGHIKLKGKERLDSMLKSGKALDIFSIKERDLRTFVREAKTYGIVYCALRSSKQTPDGLCDIMVKADDSPKINRLVERFNFATVDKARIESEVLRDMAAQTAEAPAEPPTQAEAQPGEPEINDVNNLLDELLGIDEGKASPEAEIDVPDKAEADRDAPDTPEPPAPKKPARSAKKDAPAAETKDASDPLASGGRNPSEIPQPPKTSPSEPSSDSRKKSENPILNRSSVKEELREITAAQKAKEAEALRRDDTPTPAKKKESPATTHKQPQNKRKPKSKKER